MEINNPACYDEPVVYTITGPVTETSHSNFKIVLKPNPGIASGTVTVTAVSGNYTDSYTFNFQRTIAAPAILNPQINGTAIERVTAQQTYSCYLSPVIGATYTWTIEGYAPNAGGGIITSGQGTSTITFVPNECNLGIQLKGRQNQNISSVIPENTCYVLIKVKAIIGNCETAESEIVFLYNGCNLGNLPCCTYAGEPCCVDCSKIYPNPVNSHINAEFSDGKEIKIYSVNVSSITGVVLKKYNFVNGIKKISIDVSDLKEGNYFLNYFDSKTWNYKQFKIVK